MRARDLPDEAATRALGAALGRLVSAGDVLALRGPLGAGKTCLTQGLAVGLQVPDPRYVNSPTFAIHQIHHGRIPLHHIDLYRIEDPDEALGLGLEEVVGVDGVAVVEWPDRLPALLPADSLWIVLEPVAGGRSARLEARGPRGERLLAGLPAA